MNMDLFTGLWNILKDIVGWFQICTFVDPWDEGIIVRRGKFSRVIGPGIAWHLPFGLDDLHVTNVKPTAMELEEQSVTSKDGKKIVCKGLLMWSIFDVKKSMIEVENAEDTLQDIAVGVIQSRIEVSTWQQVRTAEFRRTIKRDIQKQARKWGITVSTFKFTDLVIAPAYRIFGGLTSHGD